MPAPKHPSYDRQKLMEALRGSRGALQWELRELYGKGGIGVLGKEIMRLIEDLGTLVSGDRDWFRSPDGGVSRPSDYDPSKADR